MEHFPQNKNLTAMQEAKASGSQEHKPNLRIYHANGGTGWARTLNLNKRKHSNES